MRFCAWILIYVWDVSALSRLATDHHTASHHPFFLSFPAHPLNKTQLNRGGILFDFEKHAIAFGWMYFFLIFIDRWITILSGRGVFVFFADNVISSDYTFGVGWATIFLLVSAGTFELNLANITAAGRTPDTARLGVHDRAELAKKRTIEKKSSYRTELRRFVSTLAAIFTLTTAFVLGLSFSMGPTALVFYACGVVGYACIE